jgi:hypothetical protein
MEDSDYYYDSKGYIQPPQIHPSTPERLRFRHVQEFPSSAKRPAIYAGWLKYIAEFSAEVAPRFCQLVGGSFLTTKEEPNDIDVVNFVPAENYSAVVNRFDEEGGSKDTFLVDGRTIAVYPEDSPMNQLTQMQLNHWSKIFGHDRHGHPKGMLRMEHDNVHI